MGWWARSTWRSSTAIIDPNGKGARVFEKVKDTAAHPDEVEAALQELKKV